MKSTIVISGATGSEVIEIIIAGLHIFGDDARGNVLWSPFLGRGQPCLT